MCSFMSSVLLAYPVSFSCMKKWVCRWICYTLLPPYRCALVLLWVVFAACWYSYIIYMDVLLVSALCLAVQLRRIAAQSMFAGIVPGFNMNHEAVPSLAGLLLNPNVLGGDSFNGRASFRARVDLESLCNLLEVVSCGVNYACALLLAYTVPFFCSVYRHKLPTKFHRRCP
jgi:hypothetical protein